MIFSSHHSDQIFQKTVSQSNFGLSHPGRDFHFQILSNLPKSFIMKIITLVPSLMLVTFVAGKGNFRLLPTAPFPQIP